MICPNCQHDRHPQEFNHGNQCDYCWSEQARQRQTTRNRRKRAHIEANYGIPPNDGTVKRDTPNGRITPPPQPNGCLNLIIAAILLLIGGCIASTIFEAIAN